MEQICVLDYTCLFKYGSGNLQVQHFVDEIMPTHFLSSFKTFIEHIKLEMTEKGNYYSSRFITKMVTTANHFCNTIVTFQERFKFCGSSDNWLSGYWSSHLHVNHFVDEYKIMTTHSLHSFKIFIEHVQLEMTEKGNYYIFGFYNRQPFL